MRRIRAFFFRLAGLFNRNRGGCARAAKKGNTAIAQLLEKAGAAEW